MCRCTVWVDSTSCAAISASVCPRATSRSTSRSRSVSAGRAPRHARPMPPRRARRGTRASRARPRRRRPARGSGRRPRARRSGRCGCARATSLPRANGMARSSRRCSTSVGASTSPRCAGGVEVVHRAERRERDVAGGRAPLELDELGALVGRRVGEEQVRQDPGAEAPVLIDDRQHGLARGGRSEVDAAGVGAVEHESLDALGMPGRVHRRHARARRRSEEARSCRVPPRRRAPRASQAPRPGSGRGCGRGRTRRRPGGRTG